MTFRADTAITILIVVLTFAAQTNAEAHNDAWAATILLECDEHIGGLAVGDVDPDSPGDEIAAVTETGDVWLIRRNGSNDWQPQRIHAADGELIMCAIGDVDPNSPGNELVAVGMVRGRESQSGPGQVLVLRRDANTGSFTAEQAFVDGHMIHGVAIGDVSARHLGNEIIACGFNHRVTLLSHAGDHWDDEVIYVANDRLKIGLIADIYGERPGMEAMVCGSDGRVVVLHEAALGWRHEVAFESDAGQSRIAKNGMGVLVGGDDGAITLLSRRRDHWWVLPLGRDTAKIRGVAFADADGDRSDELYVCGYSGNVTLLVQSSEDRTDWHFQVIYSAVVDGTVFPLHHLVAGELDPQRDGEELVTAGHAGRVIMLSRNN